MSLGEASMGAGLSRHDDVERTSPMLGTVASMHRRGASIVSHHTVVPPRASVVIAAMHLDTAVLM